MLNIFDYLEKPEKTLCDTGQKTPGGECDFAMAVAYMTKHVHVCLLEHVCC